MTDEELSMLIAFGNVTRLNLQQLGKTSVGSFGVGEPTTEIEQADSQLFIAKLIRGHQKSKEFQNASGAMIWLHSFRSLAYPELRFMGREMWSQLERGMWNLDGAYDSIQFLNGYHANENVRKEAEFIPPLLDPENIK